LTDFDERLEVSDTPLSISRRERERAYLLIDNMYIHPFTSHKEKESNEVHPDHECPKPIGSLEDETSMISIPLGASSKGRLTSIDHSARYARRRIQDRAKRK
jgi:hypothetical protein